MDEVEILKLANQQRKQKKLLELKKNPLLESAAERKTSEMVSKNYFDHYSPENETIADLVPEQYKYFAIGENLAYGYQDPKELINAWMESKTHRENILYPKYKDHAMSITKINKNYLVAHVFGVQQQEYLREVKGIREFAAQRSENFLEGVFWGSAILFLAVGVLLLLRKAGNKA